MEWFFIISNFGIIGFIALVIVFGILACIGSAWATIKLFLWGILVVFAIVDFVGIILSDLSWEIRTKFVLFHAICFFISAQVNIFEFKALDRLLEKGLGQFILELFFGGFVWLIIQCGISYVILISNPSTPQD